MSRFVGAIEKNWRERIEVREDEYRGHLYVDIRIYWRADQNDEWKPSKKGVTLKPSLVKELITLLQKTEKEEK